MGFTVFAALCSSALCSFQSMTEQQQAVWKRAQEFQETGNLRPPSYKPKHSDKNNWGSSKPVETVQEELARRIAEDLAEKERAIKDAQEKQRVERLAEKEALEREVARKEAESRRNSKKIFVRTKQARADELKKLNSPEFFQKGSLGLLNKLP